MTDFDFYNDMRRNLFDEESYEQAGKRISKLIDLSKIRNKNDFREAMRELARNEPAILNLFSTKKGRASSGIDNVYNSDVIQTNLIFDDNGIRSKKEVIIKKGYDMKFEFK